MFQKVSQIVNPPFCFVGRIFCFPGMIFRGFDVNMIFLTGHFKFRVRDVSNLCDLIVKPAFFVTPENGKQPWKPASIYIMKIIGSLVKWSDYQAVKINNLWIKMGVFTDNRSVFVFCNLLIINIIYMVIPILLLV